MPSTYSTGGSDRWLTLTATETFIETDMGLDTQVHPFTSTTTYTSLSAIPMDATGLNLVDPLAAVDIMSQKLEDESSVRKQRSLKPELVTTTITGLDAQDSPYSSVFTNTLTPKAVRLTTTGIDAAGTPFTSIFETTLMPVVRYLTAVGLDSSGHTVTRIVGEASDLDPKVFLYTTTGVDSSGHSFTSVLRSTLKTEVYSYATTYTDRDGSTYTSVLQKAVLPQDFYYTITGVDGNGKAFTSTLQKSTRNVQVLGTSVMLPVEPSTTGDPKIVVSLTTFTSLQRSTLYGISTSTSAVKPISTLVNSTGIWFIDPDGSEHVPPQISLFQYLAVAFLPLFLAIFYSIPWRLIENTTRHMEPIYQLQSPSSATTNDPMTLDYESPLLLTLPFIAFS
ncbi:hypothetical protein ACMFMG_005660 [Clarireedia jacksonii]